MKKLLLIATLAAFPFLGNSQTLLSEDFQSGSIPSTWTIQSTNSQTWHVEDPLQGTDYKATVNYDESLGSQNEWLITPSLDFTTASNFVLKANVGLSYYYSVTNHTYDAYIKISKDNGATWTQIWKQTDLGVFTNWVMNPISINLGSYAGNSNVKIAFQYVGTDGAALYVDNVLVEVPPQTPPNCATPTSPANGASEVNYTAPIPLSWTAPSTGTSVESYDVFFGTSPNPTTLLTNVLGTSTTVPTTNLAGSTTYYWKVVAKNAAGSATGCSDFSFTTKANPFAPYCGPLTFTTTVEPITNVNFAGINNPSSASTTGGTAHENFTSISGTVSPGSTYTMKLQGNTVGNYTNRFVVFIDWNKNGVLNDDGEVYEVTETLVNSTGADGKEVSKDIVVPAGIAEGATRMRVKKIFSTGNYLNPCLGTSWGQAEDYTINISSLVAVSSVNKAQAKVYPNPVTDVVNIDASSKVNTVAVYDLSGKVVSTHTLNAVKNQINLGKLTSGVYMLKIDTENGTQTVKVVKK